MSRDASKLFFSRGYDNVSMDDVAKEVELYGSTLRLYFKDKESLYFAVILRGASVMDAVYGKRSMSENEGLLKLWMIGQAIIDFSRQYPDYYRALYELPPARSAVAYDNTISPPYEAIETSAEEGYLGPPELALYLIALSIGVFSNDITWKAAMEAGGLDYDGFVNRFPGFAGSVIRGYNEQNSRSDMMVKSELKKGSATNNGGAVQKNGRLLQLEIFPERLLNFETAQKLVDALNEIDGITRMVVHGPRLPAEDPENLLNGKFGIREPRFLNIKGEKEELTVQVGRIWLEVEDSNVEKKVREACEKALPFSFELYEGMYLRTRKTVTDYVRRGEKVDDLSLGMFDPKDKRGSCCDKGTNKSWENEQV
jgi:methyl-coenzyme M reductase subunit D